MMAFSVEFNQAVAGVSSILACHAAWSLILGARRGFPELRPIFAAGAVLASLYAGSLVWLAFNIDQAATWSEWMRPVGLLAWPVAWALPAWRTRRLYAEIHAAIDKTGVR